nr:ATP synthase F0 subunit 8 [Hirudo nipponia]WDA96074.1 ATP synthase F0 subunit 8 [Hirudo nipponia]
MPQLSPIHWIYSLVILWFVLSQTMAIMWWLDYMIYCKFNYSYLKHFLYKW